jgi:uncharacterized membrane protein
MSKTSPKNLYNLLISAVCAMALAIVLTKPGINPVIAVLSTFVTVLCLQVAFLRRELSALKDQIKANKRP